MRSGGAPIPVGSESASASTATSSSPPFPRLRQTAAMFLRTQAAALGLRSTKVPPAAPRLKASRPYAPLPANRSANRAPTTRPPRLENTAWRIPSVAGLTASPLGTESSIPRARPPVMRIAPLPRRGLAAGIYSASLGLHSQEHRNDIAAVRPLQRENVLQSRREGRPRPRRPPEVEADQPGRGVAGADRGPAPAAAGGPRGRRGRRNLGRPVDRAPEERLGDNNHRPDLLRARGSRVLGGSAARRGARRGFRGGPEGGRGAPVARPLRPLRPSDPAPAGPA